MTRDEVIQWAMNAGAFLELSTTPEKDITFLMSFAIQVAKHTQEQCAKMCESRAAFTYEQISDACRLPQEISDLESHECAEAIRSITV